MRDPEKKRRGFNCMTTEAVREIASKGGRAAHEYGTAHHWTAGEEAQRVGRLGGLASGVKRREQKQAV